MFLINPKKKELLLRENIRVNCKADTRGTIDPSEWGMLQWIQDILKQRVCRWRW